MQWEDNRIIQLILDHLSCILDMSIFSKCWIACLFVLCSHSLHAESITYSPEFVDSFVVKNTHPYQINEITQSMNASTLSNTPAYDIQKYRMHARTPFIIIVIPLLILLIVLEKYIFANFFKSSLQGLVNFKSFQLQFLNKKFSELIPFVILFLIRNTVLVTITMYLLANIFKDDRYLTVKGYTIGFVMVSVFFMIKILLEYIIQNIMGVGNNFKMYIVQHYIITTWLTLPLVALVLILYVNGIWLKSDIVQYFFAFVLIGIAAFSIIRTIMIQDSWRGSDWIYFFIYLCTFKIIPYLVLMKFSSELWF